MKVRKDVHSEAILNENQWVSHKYEFGLPWDGTGGRAKAPPPAGWENLFVALQPAGACGNPRNSNRLTGG